MVTETLPGEYAVANADAAECLPAASATSLPDDIDIRRFKQLEVRLGTGDIEAKIIAVEAILTGWGRDSYEIARAVEMMRNEDAKFRAKRRRANLKVVAANG